MLEGKSPKLSDVVALLQFVALSLECIKVFCTRDSSEATIRSRIMNCEPRNVHNGSDTYSVNPSASRVQELSCTLL